MHWRRKWQPTPVFLPGESQGRGSLVGCHLWGRTESDTTEATQQQQQQQHSLSIQFLITCHMLNEVIFGSLPCNMDTDVHAYEYTRTIIPFLSVY